MAKTWLPQLTSKVTRRAVRPAKAKRPGRSTTTTTNPTNGLTRAQEQEMGSLADNSW